MLRFIQAILQAYVGFWMTLACFVYGETMARS
jgi:hypothetical protein